jgi:signal transduction histidine kinase
MLESSLGKLTHDQRGTLESFMNNVASASRRMRDYVDLLRFEVRELALRPLAFDLEEVVSQVASQFYQAARSKGLELVAEASAQPLPAVNADPSRVARVLSDLISNAIKFTERGQVTISTELYDRSVAVHVVDTGVGISAAQLPRLFEDFFQDGPDLETGNRGRGLGLTLSRRLIMRMGGDLWATSTVGAGSKFSFTVPRAPESEGQPFVGTA